MTGDPSVVPVHLVDASVYVFRAWYSMPDEFADARGQPTNAAYGFARFLCELLEETGASHIAVAFDESLTTSFRNDIYPEYKANREPAPPELERQFAWSQAIARHMGLPVYADDRYEADDLIATLATCWRARGHPLHIISSDKDLAQLVAEADTWWDFARRRRMGRAELATHFGVGPEQIADFLALTGDSVDNIPGIPGVGRKTAAALLGHFGSLEAIYGRLEEIPYLSFRGAKTMARKLREHHETAVLARRLTGLCCDIESVVAAPDVARRPGDPEALEALLDELGFGPMLRQRLVRLTAGPDAR